MNNLNNSTKQKKKILKKIAAKIIKNYLIQIGKYNNYENYNWLLPCRYIINMKKKKIMITDCCPKVGDKIINRHLL